MKFVKTMKDKLQYKKSYMINILIRMKFITEDEWTTMVITKLGEK